MSNANFAPSIPNGQERARTTDGVHRSARRVKPGMLLFACMMLACGIPASAQDTYWPLDGNKRYNTADHSIYQITTSQIPLDYPVYSPRTMFSSAGAVLFTTSEYNGVWFAGLGGIAPNGTPRQAFALPGACNKYGVIDLGIGGPPHGSYFRYYTLDVSQVTNDQATTNLPVQSAVTTITQDGNVLYYGAVAAPMNTDGTRYIYYMDNDAVNNPFHNALYRYTVSSTGVLNTTPVTITTLLPQAGRTMKMSRDGKSIATIDINGNVVTYNIATNTITTCGVTIGTSFNGGFEQVTVGTERRWYLSTGTSMGYVVESTGTYTSLSTTYGITSDLALGADGNMYFAQGNPATSPGQLYRFATSGFSPVAVTGAFIAGKSKDAKSYSFGSYVPGEDQSRFSMTSFGTPSLSINGTTGTSIVNVVDCQPITLANVTGSAGAFYEIKVYQEISGSNVLRDQTGKIPGTFTSVDLRSLSSLSSTANNWLSNHTGTYTITVTYSSACGQSTATMRIQETAATPVSNFQFALNGQSSLSSSPVDVWLCNGATALNVTKTGGTGTISSYKIDITKGSYSGSTFTPSTATQSTTVSTLPANLTTLFSAYLNSYSGALQVDVTPNAPCNAPHVASKFFIINRGSNIGANPFGINGKVPASAIDTPSLIFCDGATAAQLTAAFSGTVSSYKVSISASGWNSNNTWTSASVPGTPLNKSFADLAVPASFNTFSGKINVTVTGTGPCNSVSRSEWFKVIRGTSLSGFSYTLNGQSQVGTTIPTLVLCNAGAVIKLDSPTVITGTPVSYDISITKGTYAGNVFTPSTVAQTANVPVLAGTDLATLFASYLNNYNGDLKVAISVNGLCNNLPASEMIVRLQRVSAAVDFFLIAPMDINTGVSPCTNMNAPLVVTDPLYDGTQPRQSSKAALMNPAQIPAQPQTSPSCTLGWLGTYTAALARSSKSGTATPLGTQPYNVRVDMVDPATDNIIKTVVNRSIPNITLANFGFNQFSSPINYFQSNYYSGDQIQNNALFKVTLTMTTNECGAVSQFSYFRILDGGPAGAPNYPDYWKQSPAAGGNMAVQRMSLFPNPATDQVHLTWHSAKATDGVSILLTDVLGKVVLERTLNETEGTNDVKMDISGLARGIYHYTLKTSGGSLTGKLVKE